MTKQRPIVNPQVWITGTAKWCPTLAAKHISSIRMQKYQNWNSVLYCLDKFTLEAAEFAANEDNRMVVREAIRPGASVLENLQYIWNRLSPEDVIVWLDGDDEFAHEDALSTVVKLHAEGAWVTYGQFVWASTGKIGFAAPASENVRKGPWVTTILRTFRAGLGRRLRDSDIRNEDGTYCISPADQRVMLGVIEMAGPERSVFCPEILAIYHDENSGFVRMNAKDYFNEWMELKRIRNFEPYQQIANL